MSACSVVTFRLVGRPIIWAGSLTSTRTRSVVDDLEIRRRCAGRRHQPSRWSTDFEQRPAINIDLHSAIVQFRDGLNGHDLAARNSVEFADYGGVAGAQIVEAGEPLGSICDAAGFAPIGEHADSAIGGQLGLLGFWALLSRRHSRVTDDVAHRSTVPITIDSRFRLTEVSVDSFGARSLGVSGLGVEILTAHRNRWRYQPINAPPLGGYG